ncbi:glycosyltransferase family 87 protein [Marinoscillum pacificum]|uniref:glycosyltransferase family 87 protein n=1 Tax=Marinoscillum pacificum TaxID=392723 RepID=UPI00215891A4|nr:glycosyltransferase family 87 protein [Marinoscillum pacificum]
MNKSNYLDSLNRFKRKLVFIPLILICGLFYLKSLNFPLHDYSNSYFPSTLLIDGIQPEKVVFDIYDFNTYAWNKGYPEVFIDFYLNSPFTSTFFYPFALIENAYLSKAIFNLLSIAILLLASYLMFKQLSVNGWLIGIIPLIFIIPIKNNLLFGQSYLLVFSLIALGFLLIDKKNPRIGPGLFVLAGFIKVFPILYVPALIANKKWSSLVWTSISAFLLLTISIMLGGFGFWESWLTDVLPNASANESSIDFDFRAQSFDVLCKSLFIYDPYYNPNVLFESPILYRTLKLLIKGVIIGVAVYASVINRTHLFKLLAIWIVTGFLWQSRTASYAQIMWCIPLIVYQTESPSIKKTIIFAILVFSIANVPYPLFVNMPIIFQYVRLWFTVAGSIMFLALILPKLDYRYMLTGIAFILLINYKNLDNELIDHSEYVLSKREHFIVHDFGVRNDQLFYNVITAGGSLQIETNIKVFANDTSRCSIRNNQIYLDNNQITFDPSLKKKPMIINNEDIYYLTDRRSRRGAFTLKKINISTQLNKNLTQSLYTFIPN